MDTSNSSEELDTVSRDEMGEQSPSEIKTEPAESSVAPMDMELPNCIPQNSSSYTKRTKVFAHTKFIT